MLGAGCSAGGGSAEPGSPGDVAAGLAVRAEGVAAALDSGRCEAALAEARSLQADLAATDLEPAVRAEALAGAARLANGIVCAAAAPPPVPTTVAVARNPDGGGTPPGKKRKERKGDDRLTCSARGATTSSSRSAAGVWGRCTWPTTPSWADWWRSRCWPTIWPPTRRSGSRFIRESRLTARLCHPNVVQVFDAGGDDRPFLVMEYVDGETVADRLARRGGFSGDEPLTLALHLSAGLAHAHARGIVHRDVKPHNVLLRQDGMAKLTDFGIAKALEESGLTETGSAVGTARFMAPEQAAGQPVGPPADVYALGAFLRHVGGGALPPELAALVDACLLPAPGRPPVGRRPPPAPDGTDRHAGRWRRRGRRFRSRRPKPTPPNS